MLFGPKMNPSSLKVSFSMAKSSFPLNKSNNWHSVKKNINGNGSSGLIGEECFGFNVWMVSSKNGSRQRPLVVDCSANGGINAGEKVSVLVIGEGGREHALCYAVQRSPSCDTLFCAPDNVGIPSSGDATCLPDLDISDSSAVAAFCQKNAIDLVVVGPEAPPVAGLANDLVEASIPTFGPSSEAAALEGSKDFMKSLVLQMVFPRLSTKHLQKQLLQKSISKSKGHLLSSRPMA